LVSLECDWPMQWTGSSPVSFWKCVDKKRTLARVNREHEKCCEE